MTTATRQIAVTCLATLLAFGCSAGAPENGGASGNNSLAIPDELSGPESEAFADGRITLEEYRAAFQSWVECAAVGGGVVEETASDAASGVIGFRTGAPIDSFDPPSPERDCYLEHFDNIESYFMSTDAGALEYIRLSSLQDFRDRMEPCLRSNNVEIPDNLSPGTERYGVLLDEFVKLSSEGKCA